MAKLSANSVEGRCKAFLERIENLMAEGDTAKAEYMNDCKARREDIKSVYTEAKDAGIPPKALRGTIKHRELERKQNAIADGLDIDEASVYQTLVEAFGPLGMAAAKAAGHAPEGDDKDLRPDNLKQADKERADESALAGVGRGH